MSPRLIIPLLALALMARATATLASPQAEASPQASLPPIPSPKLPIPSSPPPAPAVPASPQPPINSPLLRRQSTSIGAPVLASPQSPIVSQPPTLADAAIVPNPSGSPGLFIAFTSSSSTNPFAADGEPAYPSMLYAAVTKGVENAIIRAFNTMKIPPKGGLPPGEFSATGPNAEALPPSPPSAGPCATPLERVWYTGASGTRLFLDFSADPPIATRLVPSDRGLDTDSTASFTDPATGQLRLYTDGMAVYNGRTHAPLADGISPAGAPMVARATWIVPAPGSNRDLFYLLTSAAGRISYSIADLSEAPHGRVVLKDRPLAVKAVDALGIVPHADGRSLWVLALGASDRLDAYRLDAASGLANTPVSSPSGIEGPAGRGSIVHAPDLDTLALTLEGRGIAVAKIDRATGKLVEARVRASGAVGATVAFSPGGTKLYFTRECEGTSGMPWQLDLKSGEQVSLSIVGEFGGPKLAPDGKIYWTGAGRAFLSAVDSPDESGEAARFNLRKVSLRGATAAPELPTQASASLEYLPEPAALAKKDEAVPGSSRQAHAARMPP